MTSFTLRLSETVVLRDEDLVCFEKSSGCILQLNESGYTILIHFEEPRFTDDVVQSVREIFNISTQEARNWVEEFVNYLVSLRILRLEGSS